jgi:hypothetical protein
MMVKFWRGGRGVGARRERVAQKASATDSRKGKAKRVSGRAPWAMCPRSTAQRAPGRSSSWPGRRRRRPPGGARRGSGRRARERGCGRRNRHRPRLQRAVKESMLSAPVARAAASSTACSTTALLEAARAGRCPKSAQGQKKSVGAKSAGLAARTSTQGAPRHGAASVCRVQHAAGVAPIGKRAAGAHAPASMTVAAAAAGRRCARAPPPRRRLAAAKGAAALQVGSAAPAASPLILAAAGGARSDAAAPPRRARTRSSAGADAPSACPMAGTIPSCAASRLSRHDRR